MTQIHMTNEASANKKSVLAIDCCEHILTEIRRLFDVKVISAASRTNLQKLIGTHKVQLVVIGINQNPVRRFFLNRLRHFYPDIPILFLRRERGEQTPDGGFVRGEFLLDTDNLNEELEIVTELRKLFPLRACEHISRSKNYYLLREAIRVIKENYADPHLTLESVAGKILVSPSRLSRLLNQQAGINFRQLLRQVRIGEAKLMLATHRYNVKEVAARTGFSDSHYFSHSFKKVTGVNATDYEYSVEDLIFN